MKRSSAQQETMFQEYKSLLFSIAYHMLGSVMDAEDCVQEAFLQWYVSEQEEAVEQPKAYLCTLVTRRCIDRLRSAQTQRETYVGLWLPEPLVESTDPSERAERGEALSLAFLLLLERLSPIERAVFLLRQVFDYDYAEIAPIVGKSAENCRQIMHRARRHLPARPTPTPTPNARQWQVCTQFFQALMNGDMKGLLQVLSDEVVLHSDGGGKVRTVRHPLYGPDRVTRYLLGLQQNVLPGIRVALRPTLINGQPGLIGYLEEDLDEQPRRSQQRESKENSKQPGAWHQRALEKGEAAFAIGLLCIDKQVQEIDIIVNPEKLRHLPARTDDDPGVIVEISSFSPNGPITTRTCGSYRERKEETMTVEENKKNDEAAIQRLLDDGIRSLQDKNIEGVMSLCAPEVVAFDIVPPLRLVGADAYRKRWEELFFVYQGPIDYEMHDLSITVGDDVAFAYSLNRISGTMNTGQKTGFWLRSTACFRKIGGTWLLMHTQSSVPVDVQTGRAVLDLKP